MSPMIHKTTCDQCGAEIHCACEEEDHARAVLLVLSGGTVCTILVLLVVFNFAATMLEKNFPIDRELLLFAMTGVGIIGGWSINAVQHIGKSKDGK